MADVVKFDEKTLPASVTNQIAAGAAVEGARPLDWWRRQSAQLQAAFSDTITVSMRNGETAAQAAARVSGGIVGGVRQPGIMDTARNKANSLVATSMNNVNNQTRLATFQANSDVVKWVRQLSTLDSRTSDVCIAYSNAVWDVNTLEPVGRNELPWNGGPPRHFNCRSTIVPVTKSFEELGIPAGEVPVGTRASIDGQVPADITFDQFLKGKSKTFQDELLGPARANLWRQGKITLTQLVDMRGNPLTVEQLRQLTKKRRKKPTPPPTPATPAAVVATGPFQKTEVTDVDENRWHATAWQRSPDYLREAVEDARPLSAVTERGSGAYFQSAGFQKGPGVINMPKQKNVDNYMHQGTWRHEYGHFLDSEYANQLTREEFIRAKFHISYWGPMAERFGKDQTAVLAKAGKTRPTRAKNIAKGEALFEDHLRKTMDQGDEYLDKQFKKHGTTYAEMRALHRRNMDSSVDSPNDAIMRNKMVHTLVAFETQNAHYYVEKVWERQNFYHAGNGGYLADYFGAMTRNKVGLGHSDRYYKDGGPAKQTTEMFANATALIGDDPAWRTVMKGLGSVEFYDGVDRLLKNKGKW